MAKKKKKKTRKGAMRQLGLFNPKAQSQEISEVKRCVRAITETIGDNRFSIGTAKNAMRAILVTLQADELAHTLSL